MENWSSLNYDNEQANDLKKEDLKRINLRRSEKPLLKA